MGRGNNIEHREGLSARNVIGEQNGSRTAGVNLNSVVQTGGQEHSVQLVICDIPIQDSRSGVHGKSPGNSNRNSFQVLEHCGNTGASEDNQEEQGEDYDQEDDLVNAESWISVDNRGKSGMRGSGSKKKAGKKNTGIGMRVLRSNGRKGPGPHG